MTRVTQLHDRLAGVDVDPEAARSWLRAYHGALARRLVHEGSRLGWRGAPAARADGVGWLHPRAVWAARVAAAHPELVDADAMAVDGMLAAAGTDPPPLEHVGADGDEPWVRWGVAKVDGEVRRVWDQLPLRLAAAPLGVRQANVDEALAVLARVWPAAAEEFHLQVRAIVHVEGGGFKSATSDETFGAIFLGERYNDSVSAAFEMAVHESGHLALVLRNRFQPFVVNGAEMASHPLRTDPRPISGTVHATYALARMATGLARWLAEGDAPADVTDRAARTFDDLRGAMAVLRERAAWTDAGRSWFTRLEQHTEALR